MNRLLPILLAGFLVFSGLFSLSATTTAQTPAQGPGPLACDVLIDHGAGELPTQLPLPTYTNIVQGQKYPSKSGAFYLLFQADGNLVVNNAADERIWGLDTIYPDIAKVGCVVLGQDGNLVARTADQQFLWAPTTDVSKVNATASLDINGRGALQVVSGAGDVLWSSDGDLTSELDRLKADIKSCRAGTTLLASNMYLHPEDPATATSGKRAWTDVYDEFKATNLTACTAVGAVVAKYQGLPVMADTEKVFSTNAVDGWTDLFDGDFGIVVQGDRIPQYCPAQHLSQFDCVKATERIESSIGSVDQVLGVLEKVTCFPAHGWTSCALIADPGIVIQGASTVTQPAMDLAVTVYTEMTKRLTADYPKSAYDGFVVYITNAGAWSEVGTLPTVGIAWLNTVTGANRGDNLRGGAFDDFLWIDEQMMCKTGVATRNDGDTTKRTVDQVVHEFAHTLIWKYSLQDKDTALFGTDVEAFPWAVQGKFTTPESAWTNLNADQKAFVDKLFGPKSHTFTCF